MKDKEGDKMKEGPEPGFMEKIKRVLPLAESTIANTFLVLRAMSTVNGLKDTHKFLDVRNLVGWCCRNSKYGNVGKPPPPFNINTNAACESLHYPYLCHRIASSQEDGITVLIFIVQQLARVDDPAVVSSLISIFTDALALVPHVPESLLSSAYNAVLGFVLWPAPHSQMALHLLDLLFVEMRVPGTAFREHLLASNHLSLKRNEHVYFTLDTSVDNSCQFHEQIQLAAPVNQEQVLRAFLVHSCTGLGQNKISYLKQALQGLNFDDLNLVSSLVYDIQQQFAREEDVELARKTLDETLFSVFHHVISEAPVTKDLYQAPCTYMQFLAFDSSIPIHASRALENIIYSVRDKVLHTSRRNRPYLNPCDSVGSMLSYEVQSMSSSYAFLNGRCSRSESNASETTDLQSQVSDNKEISADSISVQISNLLDGFQEFLEPENDLEDTINEETISSNLMKFKSNRDSAESEDDSLFQDTGFGSSLDLDALSEREETPVLSPSLISDIDAEDLMRKQQQFSMFHSRSSLSSSKSSSSVYSTPSTKRPTSWTGDDRVLTVSQLVCNWVQANKTSFNSDQEQENLCLRCGKPHDKVKIALVGSDRTVAAMATSYSEMLSQSTKKCGKLDLEFYYVPLRTHTVPHKNIEISQYKIYIKSEYNLSDYLCHMDPMYAQRLFYPVHTVLRILPSIKPCPDSQEFEKTTKDPALILRSSINSYLLHAHTPYHLSVYRVELWKNEVSYTALTMTQWLEVGFPASVHDLPAILAQKKKRRKSVKTKDLKLSSADLSFVPPELHLKLELQSGGCSSPLPTGGTYWSIVAANVPRPDLTNRPPDPQSSSLSLTVIEAISKSKNKGMEFLPSEEIKEYQIASMNIESESTFDIVIDHYKYTHIKKVHITPWHSVQNSEPTNIVFPLRIWSAVDH
ncbi:uncharacterized protein LOC134816304 isoform X3 [Bolinopsis microptera]|uniref:uncharacterized protein LOC134816304 isoform X3 n=1 Tax=Bolinopsis microptera TaxID=2820187 RepID=UPI003079AC1F